MIMAISNNRGSTNQQTNSQQIVKGKVRYVKSLDTTGWLWVKLYPYKNQAKDDVYLCEYTKVLLQKVPEGQEKSGKTFFKIMEGPYTGKMAFLSDGYVGKCLIQTTRSSGAKLDVKIIGRDKKKSEIRMSEYNQLMAIMSFNGDKASITLDSDVNYKETNKNSPNYGQILHSSQIPKGVYKVMAPDFPKDKTMTGQYRTTVKGGNPNLKYDTVWFPVQYAANHNSSFVHVGHLSEGCITVYETTKWNSVYLYLIKNRSDKEGKYVGILEIQ
ncbi:hypothetical protein YT28_23740 [Salmonella enterica subsp. salamae]|nr:hypothetical protein [Salmonella enterica subsp. salamae]EDW4474298.1 hypothetical protein [Salmonella enterica subsp. salamae]